MYKTGYLFILIFLFSSSSFAQLVKVTGAEDDSANVKELGQVVVTATRTERMLSNVTVPTQLISHRTISLSGSQRLNDILMEQTGLFITSSGATSSAGGGVFGNGVQIQGLSPDYTMVLIDGEPVIGRQGGVLDLSRLTTGNIKKIEIIKGPSSSLYGSEAMGGVINIITGQAQQNKLSASFRYGRFHANDAAITYGVRKDKWAIQLFGNRSSSDGFDNDKTTQGKTVDPYKNYTGQIRFNARITPSTKLSISTRYYNEVQQNLFPITDISNGSVITIAGQGNIQDYSLSPFFTQQVSKNIQSTLRFQFSRYEYEQNLLRQTDKTPYYYDFFRQDLYRAENQTDWKWIKNNDLTIGAGIVSEKLNTTRYSGKRGNDISYAYLQNEWQANKKFILIGGLRFDDNTAYKAKWSPKLSMQFKLNKKFRLNGSYGAGFKAPDFRQLFLNFLNTAAGGYVVYGANEITAGELLRQQQDGIISQILPRANELTLLKPEISKGFNLGAIYDLTPGIVFKLNLFRNDIENLIQVDIIAYRANGAPVYSYFNVREAFTQGAELQAEFLFTKNIQLQGGYQFLMTADKADLLRIKEGNVYTRDLLSGSANKVSRADYAGLPNRSAHMANAKLFYENSSTGWSGSLRAIYRNRWGTYDKEGNGIINREDEFAKGFITLNLSAARTIGLFKIQAGVDNLFNYKDLLNLPAQTGIQPYVSVQVNINGKTKQKNKQL